MPKSKIIQEIVNDTVVETILLRLKVILSDLDSELINIWIDKELHGYLNEDNLPNYRITTGIAYGTIIVGNRLNGMKYTNAVIPVSQLHEDYARELLEIRILDSAAGLEDIINTEGASYEKPLGRDVTQYIETTMNGHIATMSVKANISDLIAAVSAIKAKVLDICLRLEREFGNLDDYDILESISEDQTRKDQVINLVISMVFDSSIKIGDNNKIVKSTLGDGNE